MHVDVGARTAWGVALSMVGAARDLRTGPGGGGDVAVVAEASVRAGFDVGRTLVSLETTPAARWAQSLLGTRAGGGFRRRIDEALAPEAEEGSALLRMVLDDLPAGALISGYAWVRLARRQGHDPSDLMSPAIGERMIDLCSGWRRGGQAMDGIAAGMGVPLQDCPPAPDLALVDPVGWHAIGPLEPDWMRRRRCIDVAVEDPADPAGRFSVWSMFRDCVGEPGGGEAVLHEYVVEVDGVGAAIEAVRAEPRVLPFPECPGAAPHVEALVGRTLSELPTAVPETLAGIASCTHLNDLLRALGGAAQLVEAARLNDGRR
jgi:hypothetical protein